MLTHYLQGNELSCPTSPTFVRVVDPANASLADMHGPIDDAGGVGAAGTRARGALGDLGKLSKARRAEIQEKKNAAKAAK